jgi:hypothetical protein
MNASPWWNALSLRKIIARSKCRFLSRHETKMHAGMNGTNRAWHPCLRSRRAALS